MPAPFPDEVRDFVESTLWTFAKTYAATWPHEYVVRTAENALMILALARHIFELGADGRFYSQIREYDHEGGKVYWSMDPTPEAGQVAGLLGSTTIGSLNDRPHRSTPASRKDTGKSSGGHAGYSNST